MEGADTTLADGPLAGDGSVAVVPVGEIDLKSSKLSHQACAKPWDHKNLCLAVTGQTVLQHCCY